MMKRGLRRGLAAAAILLLAGFVGIQWVPCPTKNPSGGKPVKWDSPQTEHLFRRACADCHSNETVWPWYSRVAPVSWFVSGHVQDARADWNISTDSETDMEEVTHQIRRNKMPLPSYLWLHPEARLTEQEKTNLLQGLEKTLSPAG